MAFYNDQENVVSAAMTVVQNLMDKYEIDPRSIGRYRPSAPYSIVPCSICITLHTACLNLLM